MKVYEMMEILKENSKKDTNLKDISFYIEDDKFVIKLGIEDKTSTALQILNFIEEKLKEKDCKKDEFLNLDVYIDDLDDLFALKELDDYYILYNFSFRDYRGVLLLKVEKDEINVKKAYKKILNILLDLDIADINKIIDKTSTNSIESFKEFKTNLHDLLREKGLEEYIKSWGKPNDINEISDFDLCLPYMYMDVIEEKDFYYVSFGLFPDESFHG